MRGVLQAAPVYDAFVGTFGLAGVGRLRQRLVSNLVGEILEIGVGTGLNLRHYGPGARVTGIDPAPNLLRAAAPRARGYDLVLASAAALPFPDATFDMIVSPLVFCSIPTPLLIPALAELRRVLRPDGQLLLLEHTRTDRPWLDLSIDALAPLWLRLSGGCHLDRDTPALLACAGWHIARHERHAYGLYRLLVALPSMPIISHHAAEATPHAESNSERSVAVSLLDPS
jgi:ubiquinone/menaquinone biosynthesis C-methylase UbiE